MMSETECPQGEFGGCVKFRSDGASHFTCCLACHKADKRSELGEGEREICKLHPGHPGESMFHAEYSIATM